MGPPPPESHLPKPFLMKKSNPWDVLGAEAREDAIREGKLGQIPGDAVASKRDAALKGSTMPLFVGASEAADEHSPVSDDDDEDEENDHNQNPGVDDDGLGVSGNRELSASGRRRVRRTRGSDDEDNNSLRTVSGQRRRHKDDGGEEDTGGNHLKAVSGGRRHHRQEDGEANNSLHRSSSANSLRRSSNSLRRTSNSLRRSSNSLRRSSNNTLRTVSGQRRQQHGSEETERGRSRERRRESQAGGHRSRSRSRSRHRTIIDGTSVSTVMSAASNSAMSAIDRAAAAAAAAFNTADDSDNDREQEEESPTRTGRSVARSNSLRRRSRSHSRSRRSSTGVSTAGGIDQAMAAHEQVSRTGTIKSASMTAPPPLSRTAFCDNLVARKHPLLGSLRLGLTSGGTGKCVVAVGEGSVVLPLLLQPFGFDAELQRTFLFTMPLVIKSQSGPLSHIISCFNTAPATHSDKATVSKFRLRALALLLAWVQTAPDDFVSRRSLGVRLQEFLEQSAVDDSAMEVPEVRSMLSQLALAAADTAAERTLIEKAAQQALNVRRGSSLPSPATSGLLMDLKAADLAQGLVVVGAQLCRAVSSRDWIRAAKENHQGADGGPVAWQRFTKLSRATAQWLTHECLVADRDERARRIARVVAVAAHSVVLKNYEGLMVCMDLLASPPLARLSRTWAVLPPSSFAAYQDLRSLVDIGHGGGVRTLMEQAQPPLVPHAATVLSELHTLIRSRKDEKGWLLIPQLSNVARVLNRLRQSVAPSFEPTNERKRVKAAAVGQLLNAVLAAQDDRGHLYNNRYLMKLSEKYESKT